MLHPFVGKVLNAFWIDRRLFRRGDVHAKFRQRDDAAKESHSRHAKSRRIAPSRPAKFANPRTALPSRESRALAKPEKRLYGFGGAAGFAASPGFGGAPPTAAGPPGRSSSGTARISCSTNASG